MSRVRRALALVVAVAAFAGMSATAKDLELISHGTWVSGSTGPGYTWYEDIAVWLDIKVPNWSYEKTVGIVWTDDGWQTHHFAEAWYEGSLDGTHEQWGIDIVPIGVLGNSYIGPAAWNGRSLLGPGYQKAEIEYAIYYILPNGWSVWDNNDGQNYRILIASRG